jgi:ATP-dependent exoDNAse (exonuclease V) alpha subunit
MSEQTGREAKTIHRLLEIDPKHGGFSRTEDNLLIRTPAEGVGRDSRRLGLRID